MATAKKRSKLSTTTTNIIQSRKPSTLALIITAAIAAVVGLVVIALGLAAGTSLYLSPPTGTVNSGQIISVAVRVNSDVNINAVQANVSYPVSGLQLDSIDYTGSAFGLQASQDTTTAGVIKIARGLNGGEAPITGDKLVATIKFKVLSTSGNVAVGFATGSAVAAADGSGTNVLSSTVGATYTLGTVPPPPPSAIMSLSPASSSVPKDGSLVVAIRENSGTAGVNAVESDLTYPAAQLQLTGISYVGSGFGVQAKEDKTVAGVLKLGRGVTGGSLPVTGDQLIATLTFKVLAASGTGAVSFSSTSAVVQASDTANILTSTQGGSYTFTPAVDSTLPVTAITSPINGANVSSGTVTVNATASDAVGVTKVELYANNVMVATDSTSPYSFAWNAGTLGSYSLMTKAYDAALNVGTSAAVTVNVVDTIAPPVPANLSAAALSSAQIKLTWSAVTDTGGSNLAGYKIYRNGSTAVYATVPAGTLTYTDSAVSASTTYSYQISAYDNAANNSPSSPAVSATTPAPVDTTAPSVPQNLRAVARTNSSISLTWDASSDNVGVVGYHLYRNGVRIPVSITTTSYNDITLAAGTSYTYTVSAFDAGANGSLASAPLTISTVKLGDIFGTDNKVNVYDLSRLLKVWNTADAVADISGPSAVKDGNVDIYDLNLLLANYEG